MLFHIQSTNSYKSCGANDPEKKKIIDISLESHIQLRCRSPQNGWKVWGKMVM